jgi:hypothetical protein
LSIVLFVLVLCLVCTASLSGLSIVLFVFVLCLVLPVYLDCPLFCLSSSCVLCWQFIWIVHCFVCLRPVSCVPCQFIWIVHCFVCLLHVSCITSLSGLSFVLFVFVLCLVLPVYLDCPLFCLSSSCVLCCQVS